MPGTGKTATLVALIQCCVASRRAVLVTGYTNWAVDNIALRLVAAGGVDFVRIGRADVVHPDVRPFVVGEDDHQADHSHGKQRMELNREWNGREEIFSTTRPHKHRERERERKRKRERERERGRGREGAYEYRRRSSTVLNSVSVSISCVIVIIINIQHLYLRLGILSVFISIFLPPRARTYHITSLHTRRRRDVLRDASSVRVRAARDGGVKRRARRRRKRFRR